MCCNSWELKECLSLCEDTKMRAIHFDVMDGHFVPNVALGTCEFNAIRNISGLPIDTHLMCNEPELFLNYFDFKKNDRVSFHPETTKDPLMLLKTIKNKGIKAGYAISPNTGIDYLKPSLDILDFVIVMAVYPGFAGQKMVNDHLDKLLSIKQLCINKNIEIVVDGNTNSINTVKMYNNGATGFVAGTSSLFKGKLSDFRNNLKTYLNEIDGELI